MPDYPPHELHHRGIVNAPSVKHPGLTTAMNQRPLPCHICHGDREKQVGCAMCAGTGLLSEIPYCETGWDEVAPNLWVGGMTTSGMRGFKQLNCDDGFFDDVYSLAYPEPDGVNGPSSETVHHVVVQSMIDGALTPQNERDCEVASDQIVDLLARGRKVLVRCLAGLNRSAFLAALVLIKQGLTAGEATYVIRTARSDYCLFNPSYAEYLRKRSTEIHGEVT